MGELPFGKTIRVFGTKEKASNAVYLLDRLLSAPNTGLLLLLFQYYLARDPADLGDTS
jgi:hypothetical protein